MKELLAAVKQALQTGLAARLRPQDVYITPALELIPNGVKAPAVGIKDGPVRRSELASGMLDVDLTVEVALFAQVLKPESSVMGDPATGQPGVLDLAAEVHAILDENTLGIAGMLDAFSPSESGSETVGTEAEMFQRKIITYRYLKQEERP